MRHPASWASGDASGFTKWLTISIAPIVPIVAPNPLVIIMNNPWALLRIEEEVILSTYSPPDTLKKCRGFR